jgi:hypothetical protein
LNKIYFSPNNINKINTKPKTFYLGELLEMGLGFVETLHATSFIADVGILSKIQKYQNKIAGSADSYRQPAMAETI